MSRKFSHHSRQADFLSDNSTKLGPISQPHDGPNPTKGPTTTANNSLARKLLQPTPPNSSVTILVVVHSERRGNTLDTDLGRLSGPNKTPAETNQNEKSLRSYTCQVPKTFYLEHVSARRVHDTDMAQEKQAILCRAAHRDRTRERERARSRERKREKGRTG